ncbi:subunit of efflux permease exporting the starvation-induced killing protein (ATP-binding protein) [Petrocella atlantisensis]|uniref:Subunit of efflux permease exporting the starvation-induced killing protein (ATP-binding protein) n=1 Tax=Petrocella atlantisensis TaxID=2173034 RepID=A0A3P7S0W9_9FIRM|nr:ABC transporter ATP-binding protein [Petrocella atlantisensis]MCF8020655.1 ABC transporter ATP-binding protein [Vallitaleaceae bacterium]VDN48516.1 subunit of efflux permease exporting the starvation-induced killing protein (ATP-binding protein) [Petrocella atlantisensis]
MIKIKDVGKTYGNGNIAVEALKQVNLNIEKGEFISIMGPSGSGKSTLMNLIGCLDRVTCGDYHLENVNVATLDDNELASIRNKKIGFVFQSFNLLPRISALKNVELPMIYAGVHYKERKVRGMEAMHRVGLADRMDHKPNEMSGGQKQRVAIARALVNRPAIILADEPTGNLDSVSSEEIMAEFQKLNEEGVTVIIVTHEPDIAEHTKRVITFADGYLTSDRMVEKPIQALDILKQKEKALNASLNGGNKDER